MMELTYGDDNFQDQVLNSKGVVVVDFWAPWCGPCLRLGPIIEEIAGEMGDKIKVGKLNVDDNPKTAMTYSIMSIPTVMIFKDGQPVETVIGVDEKSSYVELINKHL